MLRKFFDVSSGHLSADTWTWLDAQLGDDLLRDPTNRVAAGIGGGRTRYGWFVYACKEACIELPADLARICRHACSTGADYILFDCDAEPIQDFPILHPEFSDAP